jgi:hypothetical protein
MCTRAARVPRKLWLLPAAGAIPAQTPR